MINNPFKKKKLNIHAFIHVSFEGLGSVGQWIMENKHSIDYTLFYESDFELPAVDNIDWLIVMGGPMSVNDEETYPWLKVEKEFIKQAIENNKTVIGICLGAQLIADVLGAKVYPNINKEIGWLDVNLTEEGQRIFPFSSFDSQFKVFQFHGDTFDLPEDSKLIYSSEYCKNQAFIYKKRVLGLQFHLEVTAQSVRKLIESTYKETDKKSNPVPNIQSPSSIMSKLNLYDAVNEKMFAVLDFFS